MNTESELPHCPFCHEDLVNPPPKTCLNCGSSLLDLGSMTFSNANLVLSIDGNTPFEIETIPLPEKLPPLSADRLDTIWSDTITNDSDPDVTIKKEAKPVSSTSRFSVKQREVVKSRDVTDSLPDYELIKLIGEGGMGVIYSARQTSIDREIAIKMIKEKYASADHVRNKFLIEASVLGDLDHPNIVPVHELGTDHANHLFFSMKKVQGVEWKEIIGEKSIHQNLDILMRVADAVAFSHSRDVIHRDLKPENIMLGEFGEVLVMDWGLAVSVNPTGKAENVFNAGLGGTPPYMAPEMASGDLVCGYTSDVYLLGAILYEIISLGFK